ncbi:MAG TPA: hypothetical protein VHB02_14785 [Acidimicrobiales bacterium]|nr:hypothetical protein [Acidimicrobiales bacterium]
MASLQIIDPEELEWQGGYRAPFCSARGDVRSGMAVPDGFSQFVLYADLGPGAEVGWTDHHGDEGVFVLEGEVEVAGTVIPAKGAAVIEAGAPASLRATTDARLLHLGSTVPGPQSESVIGPPANDHPTVHAFGPDGKAVDVYDDIHQAFYADSYCDGCRIALFRISGPGPYVAASHIHTVDELITVTEGALQVGPDTVGAVKTVAIPAERRYGFRTSGPWEFVNFRLDASWYTAAPGSVPIRERIGAGTETS